ncbi:MAG TPA: NUDIX domain-containing protein [Dehalococcoidia bacterium]|nr:NUDIX domain-containing protein [Dehalococcoidia bacterium]
MKHCGDCGTALGFGPDESGYDRQFCTACGWTWYDPPTPVTLVLVTLDDGRVVYTRKNSFEPGRWSVVSGFIPRGERAEDAALREVKEETGLDAELVRYMGTHVYAQRPDQIVIAFHARATGGVLQAGDDVDEVEAAPPELHRLRAGSTSWWLVKSLLEPPSGLLPRYEAPGRPERQS